MPRLIIKNQVNSSHHSSSSSQACPRLRFLGYIAYVIFIIGAISFFVYSLTHNNSSTDEKRKMLGGDESSSYSKPPSHRQLSSRHHSHIHSAFSSSSGTVVLSPAEQFAARFYSVSSQAADQYKAVLSTEDRNRITRLETVFEKGGNELVSSIPDKKSIFDMIKKKDEDYENKTVGMKKTAFVTIVKSYEDILPACVLLHSLIKTSSTLSRVVLVSSSLEKSLSTIKLLSLFADEVLSVRNLASPFFYANSRSFISNDDDDFTELRLWELIQFDRVLFVDCHSVLMRNIDHLVLDDETTIGLLSSSSSARIIALSPSLTIFQQMLNTLRLLGPKERILLAQSKDCISFLLTTHFSMSNSNNNNQETKLMLHQFSSWNLLHVSSSSSFSLDDQRIRGLHFPKVMKSSTEDTDEAEPWLESYFDEKYTYSKIVFRDRFLDVVPFTSKFRKWSGMESHGEEETGDYYHDLEQNRKKQNDERQRENRGKKAGSKKTPWYEELFSIERLEKNFMDWLLFRKEQTTNITEINCGRNRRIAYYVWFSLFHELVAEVRRKLHDLVIFNNYKNFTQSFFQTLDEFNNNNNDHAVVDTRHHKKQHKESGIEVEESSSSSSTNFVKSEDYQTSLAAIMGNEFILRNPRIWLLKVATALASSSNELLGFSGEDDARIEDAPQTQVEVIANSILSQRRHLTVVCGKCMFDRELQYHYFHGCDEKARKVNKGKILHYTKCRDSSCEECNWAQAMAIGDVETKEMTPIVVEFKNDHHHNNNNNNKHTAKKSNVKEHRREFSFKLLDNDNNGDSLVIKEHEGTSNKWLVMSSLESKEQASKMYLPSDASLCQSNSFAFSCSEKEGRLSIYSCLSKVDSLQPTSSYFATSSSISSSSSLDSSFIENFLLEKQMIPRLSGVHFSPSATTMMNWKLQCVRANSNNNNNQKTTDKRSSDNENPDEPPSTQHHRQSFVKRDSILSGSSSENSPSFIKLEIETLNGYCPEQKFDECHAKGFLNIEMCQCDHFQDDQETMKSVETISIPAEDFDPFIVLKFLLESPEYSSLWKNGDLIIRQAHHHHHHHHHHHTENQIINKDTETVIINLDILSNSDEHLAATVGSDMVNFLNEHKFHQVNSFLLSFDVLMSRPSSMGFLILLAVSAVTVFGFVSAALKLQEVSSSNNNNQKVKRW